MTLIEAIKQALCQQSPFDDDKPDDYEAEAQAAYAAIADRVVPKVDLAEARNKALEEAARELAMRLVLNVENWPAEYFRGFDDARSVVAALKGSQQ